MTKEMQAALQELWTLASSVASPEQIQIVATKHDVEAWALEGHYFDEVERCSES